MSTPLTYNPWTGDPLPSWPERFADYYADSFAYWFYNPWTGIRRPKSEIQADPRGPKLAPPTPTCAPESPLRFCPASGLPIAPEDPSTLIAHRARYPICLWFYNPWTGSRRPAAEVEADPQGLKLEPPSHDPGTTSPPTPATTEAGTATQGPEPMDHEPASMSNPAPCAAPSAMNAVLSSLGAAVAEVNALTRTAVELSAKCRALQAENERLQERNDELVNRCRELDRLVDAAVKIRTPAEEAPAPDLVAIECRALQKRNDELVNRCRELLEALKASAHGLHPADDNGPCLCSQCQFVQLRNAAIAKATQQPPMRAAAGEGDEA